MSGVRIKIEPHLGQGLLALLLLGCLVILWPFVTALLWATVLSFCLWPFYGRLTRPVGGCRTLAADRLVAKAVLAMQKDE